MIGSNLLPKCVLDFARIPFTKITDTPPPPDPFGAVPQGWGRGSLPDYSPHFGTYKTWLTSLLLCFFFFFFFQSVGREIEPILNIVKTAGDLQAHNQREGVSGCKVIERTH